jgi:molybdopterin molybdotransferase
MTAQPTLARAPQVAPLAEYLGGVLARLRPLPPLEVDLAESYGAVLATAVRAPGGLPAFDQAALDGYAARWEDLTSASPTHPVRLSVAGDVGAATSLSVSLLTVSLASGSCISVAAGGPLPAGASVVVPPAWTEQGVSAIEVRQRPRRGHGVRRAGVEVPAGTPLAASGALLTPALVALLAATGAGRVLVRPSPRVAIISAGDELAEEAGPSRPGRIVDANSHALAAAAADAGAVAIRTGACADDPEALRALLVEQIGRVDLIVTSGGTGTGPGDVMRRALERDGSVGFAAVSLFPCPVLGFGLIGQRGAVVPVICLPGDPGAALVGFEVLARPVIQSLAGAEPFRRGVRAHLLDTVTSPLGLREFRPAFVSERRGGGYTARPLPGGPYTLSGMALANGMIVLGERIGTAAAGSTVDVLLLDRRR